MPIDEKYSKGRGAQQNPKSRFSLQEYVQEHVEGLDEPIDLGQRTQYFEETPKKLLNKVPSPDIPSDWSMNPYQGCEHGCIYCYARNSHNYWGLGAGLDFERKIVVKKNAPDLLRSELMKKSWKGEPIMLSGNTDAYQPIERKLKITRGLLKILLEFRNPIGIITKNRLVLRDVDILSEMANMGIVMVNISLTTLNEELRRRMEPRTATGKERLRAIKELSNAGVPVNVICGPMIPGLNEFELPDLMKHAADNGALSAGYIALRTNGAVEDLFMDWLEKNYPDRVNKVMNQVSSNHGGKMNDSRFGVRMKGEGHHAEMLAQVHKMAKKKYFSDRRMPELKQGTFRRPKDQLDLFED